MGRYEREGRKRWCPYHLHLAPELQGLAAIIHLVKATNWQMCKAGKFS